MSTTVAHERALAAKARAARALAGSRRWTRRLLDPLGDDALHTQPDRIMSPLVWDLGHIGNFEELWLLRALGEHGHHQPDLDRVYNPFDNPRWTRADLPLLRRAEAHEYVAGIRAHALALLGRTELDPDEPLLADGYVWQMVGQHEAQHQETMLQCLGLRQDLLPGGGYAPAARTRRRAPPRAVDDEERVTVPAGPFTMGAPDPGPLAGAARLAAVDAYDNERPAHTVQVAAFALDRFAVTSRRFAAFLAAGGYDQERWWSPRGWAWRQETGHAAPQGWTPDARGGWLVRRFGTLVPLDPRELVEHVCWFEADAFARWAGGRLPTEAEWEKAAAHDPRTGRSRPWPWGASAPTTGRANVDRALWGPSLAGSYPTGASAYGVEHLLGDGYEWTSSDFAPYPGYATFPYPEYSEVFFGGDHKVLRGASWATRPAVARTTYRNWDHPYRRQVFAGVRVAYDA